MKRERLRIDSMKKGSFLKWIQLQVFEQEIVHIVFDNIQEKQMFMNIITGRERADIGKLYYDEAFVSENMMPSLLDRRVAVISRDSQLIDSITIGENIFLIRPEVSGNWVRNHDYKQAAGAIFDRFGIAVDIDTSTGRLSPFEKVQVEIMKAYMMDKRILIFTDLDNSLSDQEMKQLHNLMERLKTEGLSLIVAEPLENLDFQCTDRVIVIRHGKTVAVKEISECDYTTLHTILYQNVMKRPEEREPNAAGETAIALSGLSTEYLKDVSLAIARGEIVKLFCVDEQSYEEITQVLRGKTAVRSGSIEKQEQIYEIKKTIRGVPDGIGILDGNPVSQSLFMELSAMDNLQMLLSHKVNGMWAVRRYRRSIRRLLSGIIERRVYSRRVKDLSNADVQRIAYCRWLIYSPDLLVCIQPFADGDIEAREAAREMIYVLENRRIPVLIITSNSLEFNYCRGREVYMKGGTLITKEQAYLFLGG